MGGLHTEMGEGTDMSDDKDDGITIPTKAELQQRIAESAAKIFRDNPFAGYDDDIDLGPSVPPNTDMVAMVKAEVAILVPAFKVILKRLNGDPAALRLAIEGAWDEVTSNG